MWTVKCGLQNVSCRVSFLRLGVAAPSSGGSKCSSLIWQLEIRGRFRHESLEMQRKIMLQALQVSYAGAWLGTTGGRVDWWRFCIHLHTHTFSCYAPLRYDRYTICSVILHVTGIQATPFRWFCGCQYFESTWCRTNILLMTFGVLTAVLLKSQVLWPVWPVLLS